MDCNCNVFAFEAVCDCYYAFLLLTTYSDIETGICLDLWKYSFESINSTMNF